MPILYPDYISKEYFVKRFVNAEEDLSARERKSLEKHGTKLEALKEGSLLPRTKNEKHFLLVCGGAKPEKDYERAWIKYQALRVTEGEVDEARLEDFKKSPEYIEHLESKFTNGKASR